MKNILYIHGYVNLYGGERSLLRLVTGLNRKEFCPFVLLPACGVLSEELEKYGIKCYRFPISVINRYRNPFDIIWFFIMLIPSLFFIIALIRLKKVDIVHTNTSHIFVGAIAARILGVKNIWHIREITLSPKLIARVLSFLISVFADRVIAVSSAAAKALALGTVYVQKIHVIYDGVDLNRFAPMERLGNDILRVGLVGRITRWKGHIIFLEAASLVLKRHANVKFFIIGDIDTSRNSAYKNELLETIKKFGIESNVEFLGFCVDMPKVYSELDISVIASILPDPCPNVALESMAMERLIVASRIGGLSEILRDGCALLIPPADPRSLADSIVSIAEKKENFSHLSAQAHQRAINYFDSNRNIKDIVAVYYELIQG